MRGSCGGNGERLEGKMGERGEAKQCSISLKRGCSLQSTIFNTSIKLFELKKKKKQKCQLKLILSGLYKNVLGGRRLIDWNRVIEVGVSERSPPAEVMCGVLVGAESNFTGEGRDGAVWLIDAVICNYQATAKTLN